MTSQVTGYTPPDEATQQLCRLQVCAHAESPDEAEMLMRMLGVHPREQAWADEQFAPVEHRHSAFVAPEEMWG